MKTSFDAADVVFDLLNVPEVWPLISGQVKQTFRDPESEKEDITVRPLSAGEGSKQRAVVNVNVHVPDQPFETEKKQYGVPDLQRLKSLTRIVVDKLKGNAGVYFQNGNLWVENTSNPLPQPEIKQHYINIRVVVQFYLSE